MSFSVGIVGLPNVGKSTLFKALTKKSVQIAPRPFTTIKPNLGLVQVPDKRLERLAKTVDVDKITPTTIEFIDIAGLVKGAHKGEGLGNQFLAQIRNCDAILEIIRVFKDPENIALKPKPVNDIEILNTELLMKDVESIDNSLTKLDKLKDKESKERKKVLTELREKLSQGKLISETENSKQTPFLSDYNLLTAKPILYILNSDEKTQFRAPHQKHLVMNIKDEQEITELTQQEVNELGAIARLDKVIVACYNILNLITFFTVAGKKEARAWTLPKNSTAAQAGGLVHSDFENKFIRAETVNWQKLVDSDSWQKAKTQGMIKTVGKDYIVQDGDVIEFKI
jgi:GTP-binding protein YchF